MNVKNSLYILVLASALMLFSACSSGPTPDKVNADEDLKCTRNGSPAPEWVCKNVVGDKMQTAVGSSEFSRIGENFMLREATVDGEKAMQRVVEDYIDDKLNSFSRQIGGEVSSFVDTLSDKIAKEVSVAKEEDYKQIKLWRNPADSSIEVLMAIQNKNINKDVRKRLMLEIKKEDGVFKAFEEHDGDDLLDEFLPLE